MTVQSRLRRLETLEQNCAPVLSLKERKERLRATLASVGINYLGDFPNIDKPADPGSSVSYAAVCGVTIRH